MAEHLSWEPFGLFVIGIGGERIASFADVRDRDRAIYAVNCHEDLVAALKTIKEFPVTDPKNQDAMALVMIAFAALSKVEAV